MNHEPLCSSRRSFVLAVLLAVFTVPGSVLGSDHSPSPRGALDGLSFVGTLRSADKTSGRDDVLYFGDGQFWSKNCVPCGFQPGAYYVRHVGGGTLAGHQLTDLVAFEIRPSNEPEIHRMIMAATSAYILASMLPFVPGAEIGLGIILVLGPRIVMLVYSSMVLALILAYLVGRLVPPRLTPEGLAFLGLRRASDLVVQLAPLDTDARLALLTARAPRRIVPFLLRHRFFALALAFNLPGNTLLGGGGGGIALAAGMSGLYPLGAFALTVALAVAPIPLLILLTGYQP